MEASMTLKEKLKELIRDRLIYASGIKTGDLFDHTAELTVENIISMLEPSQDKVEAVIKKLVDLCPFVDECNKQCTPADQANCWELHAREICRLFHTLPNLEKELKSE